VSPADLRPLVVLTRENEVGGAGGGADQNSAMAGLLPTPRPAGRMDVLRKKASDLTGSPLRYILTVRR
jgi:hypothetical protein